MLWEICRVALHCDLDPAKLDLKNELQEDWQDYDRFWANLRAAKAFKGCKFPPRSDPAAYELCLTPRSTNDAVILAATIHPTKSRHGPLARLELHPLKREQSCRLFRQFGSDRYLELRVPSVDSWLRDVPEAEAVAARWLASGTHDFLDRRWSGFYVRDRQLKVEVPSAIPHEESRPIFYDRVMLFADEGRSLFSQAELSTFRRTRSRALRIPETVPPSMMTCSRNSMLDWLLNLHENRGEKYLKLFHRIALGMLFHLQLPQDISKSSHRRKCNCAGTIDEKPLNRMDQLPHACRSAHCEPPINR